MEKTELTHHGIKGQKWGVRRFQTKSGSLTSAGKKRYSAKDEVKKKSKKETASVHEDYAKAHAKKPVSSLSDKELQAINNRLQAEKTYENLNPKKKSLGRKILDDFVLPAAKDIGKEYTKKYMKQGASYIENMIKNSSSKDGATSSNTSASSGKKSSKNKNKSSNSTPSGDDVMNVFKGMGAKMSNYAPQASLGEAFVAGLLEAPKN